MKKFKEFRTNGNKIIASSHYEVLRDGGSHTHNVQNSDECGYCAIIQDFSIWSKKNGTSGNWKASPMPPNHTKYKAVDYNEIEFV